MFGLLSCTLQTEKRPLAIKYKMSVTDTDNMDKTTVFPKQVTQ